MSRNLTWVKAADFCRHINFWDLIFGVKKRMMTTFNFITAKLQPNCPKPERPMREGVRRESVESGLAAAAARLANQPVSAIF